MYLMEVSQISIILRSSWLSETIYCRAHWLANKVSKYFRGLISTEIIFELLRHNNNKAVKAEVSGFTTVSIKQLNVIGGSTFALFDPLWLDANEFNIYE